MFADGGWGHPGCQVDPRLTAGEFCGDQGSSPHWSHEQYSGFNTRRPTATPPEGGADQTVSAQSLWLKINREKALSILIIDIEFIAGTEPDFLLSLFKALPCRGRKLVLGFKSLLCLSSSIVYPWNYQRVFQSICLLESHVAESKCNNALRWLMHHGLVCHCIILTLLQGWYYHRRGQVVAGTQ